MEREELRSLLAYMETLTLTMHFVSRLERGAVDAQGLPAACERLIRAEPGSLEGWRLLARVVRFVLGALDERGDPRTVLVRELHADVLTAADRAAAGVRLNGE
jgi:hypothetical protein